MKRNGGSALPTGRRRRAVLDKGLQWPPMQHPTGARRLRSHPTSEAQTFGTRAHRSTGDRAMTARSEESRKAQHDVGRGTRRPAPVPGRVSVPGTKGGSHISTIHCPRRPPSLFAANDGAPGSWVSDGGWLLGTAVSAPSDVRQHWQFPHPAVSGPWPGRAGNTWTSSRRVPAT